MKINKLMPLLIIAAVVTLSGCQKYYSMAGASTNSTAASGSVSGSVGNSGRSSSRVSTTMSGSISVSF